MKTKLNESLDIIEGLPKSGAFSGKSQFTGSMSVNWYMEDGLIYRRVWDSAKEQWGEPQRISISLTVELMNEYENVLQALKELLPSND